MRFAVHSRSVRAVSLATRVMRAAVADDAGAVSVIDLAQVPHRRGRARFVVTAVSSRCYCACAVVAYAVQQRCLRDPEDH